VTSDRKLPPRGSDLVAHAIFSYDNNFKDQAPRAFCPRNVARNETTDALANWSVKLSAIASSTQTPARKSSPKNSVKPNGKSVHVVSIESSKTTGYKKKLHRYRPKSEPPVETQRTLLRTRLEPSDPQSIERGVRQLLANKVSGNLAGLWLLVPEHLRLGTWDLLCGWTKQLAENALPRLALQLVHEAALCVTGVRKARSLAQKGFELINGLPFIGSDTTIHHLLDERSIAEAQSLQMALGQIRRVSGHFSGKLLAVDPHRVRSWSKRQMRRRAGRDAKPAKVAQTFFCLDADTHQPVCLTTATSSRTVAQATPELLRMAAQILQPEPGQILALADSEHFASKLIDQIHSETHFELLVPMPNTRSLQRQLHEIASEQFTRRWAGFATCKLPYRLTQSSTTYHQFVQRSGERSEDWKFSAYLATSDRDEVEALTDEYPKRWHVEEFFNTDQGLGWKRAGTLNLNIRYGQMTLALIAQTVLHQLRGRLGEPVQQWDAPHLAKDLLQGLDGDVRVHHDTIIVTYYNAPNAEQLRSHYEDLPSRLQSEGVDPRIPWLYGFKLDFRFK